MSKFCGNCGTKVDDNANVCSNCGKSIGGETISYVDKTNKKFPVWAIILICIVGFIAIIGIFVSSDSSNESSGGSNDTKVTNKESKTTKESKKKEEPKYELNVPFKFDDLEITLGDEISFTKIKNQFSDKNGAKVVKMPITVKNLKDETHSLNMFFYDVFGSQGTEIDTVGSYFDNDIDFAGDLRSGASYTKYLYFIYDGDGEYAIEFNNYSEKITLTFNIKAE